MLQTDARIWFPHPTLPVEVHAGTGQIRYITTKKPITIYRNVHEGTIVGYIKKRGMHQLGKLILTSLVGEHKLRHPNMVQVTHRNRDKWDFTPANLEWELKKDYMERLVFEGRLVRKMDGPASLTFKKVVERVIEGNPDAVVDIEAIGSTFNISAGVGHRILKGKHWGFVSKYMEGQILESQIIRKLEEAYKAIVIFATKDLQLKTKMAKGL